MISICLLLVNATLLWTFCHVNEILDRLISIHLRSILFNEWIQKLTIECLRWSTYASFIRINLYSIKTLQISIQSVYICELVLSSGKPLTCNESNRKMLCSCLWSELTPTRSVNSSSSNNTMIRLKISFAFLIYTATSGSSSKIHELAFKRQSARCKQRERQWSRCA